MGADFVEMLLLAEPVAASRPRVSKWGTFYAEPYKSYLHEAPEALYRAEPPMLAGPLAVVVDVVCTKPRTSRLQHPHADADNYAKSALDALTHAGAWLDDSQVVDLHVRKRFAQPGEQPHTRMRISLAGD